ncbi:MAG: apolipoprotein N-acyltransferase, partial [Gemmataceae bacterium]|nr:apolipoprotein N-acyltransferase [Gemmataceae bacterium]
AAYLGGVVFFTLATHWVRVAHPMMHFSWLGLAVVMPLFWLAALAILRRLDRAGLPLALSVPVAWVAMEYFRMHFPTGFPFMKHVGAYQMIGFGWYYLGYTQHDFLTLIQIADLGGVYAVSFVVAAVNGAVAGVWLGRQTHPPTPSLQEGGEAEKQPTPTAPLPERKGELSATVADNGPAFVASKAVSPLPFSERMGGLGFAALLLAASLGYGAYRLDHPPFADGPRVAAIQGDVSQGDKMARGNTLVRSYSKVFAQAYRLDPPVDLIVWPETCYWEDWFEVGPGVSPESASRYREEFARADKEFRVKWQVPVLFGLSGHEWDGRRVWKYNSALLVGPDAPDPIRYDKMHLVPFGEYVPLGDELPFMKWFTPYKHDYSCRPGERWTGFPLTARDGRAFTFACLICYEDSDTYLARQYVKDRPPGAGGDLPSSAKKPVNFLVNISNDGWFNGTEEHEQHLAICRFRAVETRRAVVRSVNMGISGVIDPDGRVIALPDPDWGKSKKVEAVVSAVVPIDTRPSAYAAWGDWGPASCWLVALLGAILARFRQTPA